MLNDKNENASAFQVLPAEHKHIDGIVECRTKAFPDYFITMIGPKFIKASSRFYIENEDGIIYVAVNSSGRVIGVISGGKPELRKEFSRKHLPRLAIDIIWSALKYNFVRKRLIQYVLSFCKKILVRLKLVEPEKIDEPPKDPEGTWASLLLICTDLDFAGRGIGTALMKAFEQQCRARGYEIIRLSVYNDNEAAIALYNKCGFEAVYRTSGGIFFKKRLEHS